jgi:hypothetical protein
MQILGLAEPPCAPIWCGPPLREVWTIAHWRPSRIGLAPVRRLCRGSSRAILGTDANRARDDALATGPGASSVRPVTTRARARMQHEVVDST